MHDNPTPLRTSYRLISDFVTWNVTAREQLEAYLNSYALSHAKKYQSTHSDAIYLSTAFPEWSSLSAEESQGVTNRSHSRSINGYEQCPDGNDFFIGAYSMNKNGHYTLPISCGEITFQLSSCLPPATSYTAQVVEEEEEEEEEVIQLVTRDVDHILPRQSDLPGLSRSFVSFSFSSLT